MINIIKRYIKRRKVDWDKVAIGTPILVKDSRNALWRQMSFAKYEDNKVYTWGYQQVQWSAGAVSSSILCLVAWRYARLL